MPFNSDRFERAKFEARKARVSVEALAPFFDDGEPAEWEVRGLTAAELHQAMEASTRQSSIESIIKALATKADQANAIRQALGMAGDTPGEIAKRIEMLVMASIQPTIDMPAAVKLAENFPIEFLQLTNKISELTGQGAELVKPSAASQPTQN
jgi:hypothetical protein